MSLSKCPECGKEISTEATVCPHCGYPLKEKEVIEAEVVSEEKKFSQESPEVRRYRSEIEIYKKRRTSMVTTGIVLTAVSFVLIILFSVLYGLEIARTVGEDPENAGRIVGAALVYMALIIVSSVALEGGIVLIVVGAVVNSVKIKKRENRIRNYKIIN